MLLGTVLRHVWVLAGLGADDDVFDLIKQEVQRDVQGKKKRAAGQSVGPPCSLLAPDLYQLTIQKAV